MTKKIISLSLLCILGLGMSGCKDSVEPNTSNFREVEYKGAINDINAIQNIEIFEYVDKETGVHYYIGTSGYRGIMSPVYNSDGRVRVDK